MKSTAISERVQLHGLANTCRKFGIIRQTSPATVLSLSTSNPVTGETAMDDSVKNYTHSIATRVKWLEADDVISKQIEEFSDYDEIHEISIPTSDEDEVTKQKVITPEHAQKSKLNHRAISDLNRALNKLAEQAGSWGTTPSESIAAAQQAESIWSEVYASKPMNTDLTSFNTVLKAWSKCCHVLAYHKQRRKNKPDNKSTKASAFNEPHLLELDLTVPNAGKRESFDEPGLLTPVQAARRVDKLLMKHLRQSTDSVTDQSPYIHPDTRSFNSVMHAWATCEDSGLDRVEELFYKLQDPKNANDDDSSSLMPFRDSDTYDALVEAITNSNLPDRRDRFYAIWKEVCAPSKVDDSNRWGKTIRPTVRTLNTILRAFGRPSKAESALAYASYTASGSSSEKKYARLADEMFIDMQKYFQQTKDIDDHPDSVSYTLVMECWSLCRSDDGARRADELFHELNQVYKETSERNHPKNYIFQPSKFTYVTLMKAWSRASAASNSDAQRRVQELLEEFLQHGDESGLGQQQYRNLNFLNHMDAGFLQNAAFIAVLQSWTQSTDVASKSKMVLDVLKRMKSLAAACANPALNPSLKTYNTAIDVCASCQYGKGVVVEDGSDSVSIAKQQLASLQIAFAILRAIEADGKKLNQSYNFMQPNHETYAKLLKAVESLLPPGDERNKVAKAVFQKAITAGQVDMSVVRNMQKAADVSVLQEVFFPSPTSSATTSSTDKATNQLDNDTNRYGKIHSLIVQRSGGDGKNEPKSKTSSNRGNSQFYRLDDIPGEWRKNVRR